MVMRLWLNCLLLFIAVHAHAQPAPGKIYSNNDRGQVTAVSDPAHPEADATYTYDENGNRETRQQSGILTRYDWDTRDRLVAVWRNDALVARYGYHANGLRAEKETFGAAATLVRYQYDGPWLESETNVIGNTLIRYSRRADGHILAFRRNNDIRYFLTDALGTPTALVDLQGAVVARFRYDAWGNQVAHEGAENTPIRHTGHYFDEETGLYYVAARYYDPALGAFISEDPAEGIPTRPITFNPYVAFNANPTGYVDPDGRQALPYMSGAESVAIASLGRTPEERQQALGAYSNAQAQTAWQALPIIATSYVGLGLGSAVRAGWVAYRSGGVAWGVAVGTTRAAPFIEAGAALGTGVPGPAYAPTPMPSAATAAARAEAVMAQEARGASVATYADDVPRAAVNLPERSPAPAAWVDDVPTAPTSTTSMVVEGGRGSPQLIPQPGVGPVGQTGPPGRVLSMETGPYSEMKARTDIPGQAHHLNQNSIYGERINHADAVSVKLEGNAFTEPGTPHYLVHQAQEEFLDQFRRSGQRFGEVPTNVEYTRAVVNALRRAGYTEQQSMDLARKAIQDRVKNDVLGGEPIPRLSGRINQKKPESSDEP
jgi:RHS repeat-associated protein